MRFRRLRGGFGRSFNRSATGPPRGRGAVNRGDMGPGVERRRLSRAPTSVQHAPRSASAILLVHALVDELDTMTRGPSAGNEE
jgi:hypothetical protein